MSGTRSVPCGKDLPPPLVPLPSCHARVKKLQARLFNGLPLTTSYVANCRLCLSSSFGEKSTTIIEEQLCTMLKHVFPFPIANQIGLPMNVCTDCYKSVQIFYGYSHQVQINQQKLQETLVKAEYLDYTEINNTVLEGAQYPGAYQEEVKCESQENCNDEILIDTDVQCKTEANEVDQVRDPLTQPSYYDGAALPPAAKVATISTSETPIGNMRDGICFDDCKPNANGNDTKDKNAETTSLEFIRYRKKARLSSEESGHKTLEQNATKLANSLVPKPLYICSICNQTFDKHHQLICHQKTHLMKECPICNQSIQYALLAKHVIQEHAERDRRGKT